MRLKLDHLYRMTDSVGLLEHALMAIPDLREGYCVDDNARALRVALRLKDIRLVEVYLKFLISAAGNEGFRNDLDRGGNWSKGILEENFGRAMAALADTLVLGLSEDQKMAAAFLFDQSVSLIEKAKALRSKSWLIYALVQRQQLNGNLEKKLTNYKKVKLEPKRIEIMEGIKSNEVIKKLADEMSEVFEKESSENWEWFENKLTYDNGRLPWAMFWAYKGMKNDRYLNIAKKSLDFLIKMTYDNNKDCFVFPGCRGWFTKTGERNIWGQQPIQAGSTAEVSVLAYEITENKKYLELAKKAGEWFEGRNISKVQMADNESGGVYDGIEKEGINLNQGAESLLAYLMTRIEIKSL